MSSVAGPSSSTLSGAAAAPSSDDDVHMVDSNGDAIAAGTSADAAGAAADDDAAAAAADGEGDADSEPPEDEYEIEYIVSHSHETTDGQLSYMVKWKGYPDSENSWVWESDMGGAQEMIRDYWAKVPEKRVKKMGTKGKKGKRQSVSSPAAKAAVSTAGRKSSRRESSLLLAEAPRSGGGGGGGGKRLASRSVTPDDALIDVDTDPALQRIRSDPTLTDEQRQLLEAQHLHAVKLERLRKRYARIADWDPIVKRVEAVEKMSDNKLRVFVHFESGDKLAFESVVVHHRCPLKLLAFYESNLRFKKRDDDEERVEMLRGDEQMTELDEYQAQAAAAATATVAAEEGGVNGENGAEANAAGQTSPNGVDGVGEPAVAQDAAVDDDVDAHAQPAAEPADDAAEPTHDEPVAPTSPPAAVVTDQTEALEPVQV